MAVLGGLIGESPGLVAVRTQVEQFLRRQAGSRRLPPVLILGETGTGKGLLARAIHDAGPRAAGPFVAVNCAAIPETLLEAELFGFEQGAFTDARHAKAGLFQTASRGTLFLDEIGLLSEGLQAKLLTVIEDRAVRRLGSTHPEVVDVWIIAATSADIKPGSPRRRLREDLFHRLAVVTFQLPALRERGRDVLILAEHFLARTCTDYGLAPKTFTDDAQRALLAYGWPGNVRELANLMERVALLTDARSVTADSLEISAPRRRTVTRPHDDDASATRAPSATSLERAVGEVEQTRIREALHETGGNISHAAHRLGITRNTLRYRLTKYRLQAADPKESPTPAEPVSVTAAPSAVKVQWERRYVAVLRADLVPACWGGTAPNARQVLETLAEKIDTFGGQVEDVSPHGLMAGFGLEPVDDAPRRAAHAALAIQKIVARERGSSAAVPGVRVGLHVGEAFVGRIGVAARLDHDFKRETWTQLEAFMGCAEPGTVLMSEATRPFLQRRFVVAPCGTSEGPDGKAYRLEGLERTGLGLGEQLTPFMARGRELTQLAQALEQAQTGHGQVVAVVGEAGVGKSRLFWEFIDSHRTPDSLIAVGSAAPYGKTTPYLPVVNLLKTYFQIEARDGAGEVEERVTAKILSLGQALAPALPAVLSLLDIPPRDAQWDTLDPLQKQRRTLEAVKIVLLGESRVQPIIVVFEDLHWVDSKTQAVLDTLIESLTSHRVLLLVSYRPEYEHGWANKSCYSQVRLDPLSPDNARSLLDSLVGRDAAIAAVKAGIIERTAGNPFFIEECVRTLVETGVLDGDHGAYRLVRPAGELQVPATVQAVLGARIDRLPPEERALLQTAAVIGKDVPLALLQAAAELPEVRSSLMRLQGSELMYETRLVPEAEYAFKHALTHEVAYAGLVQDRRQELHARIMGAIEHVYADRLAEQLDRLAHHAFRGEVWHKAVAYGRQAGMKAAARLAHREAVACFEQALEALRELPESREAIERRIDLLLEFRNSLFALGESQRLFDYLREGEILAEQIGDQRRLGWISAFMTHSFWIASDLDSAVHAGRRALAAAAACGDFALRIVANLRLGQAYLSLGEYPRAREYLQSNVESLEGNLIRERFGEAYLLSVMTRVWLVHVLTARGEFAEGIVRGEEGVQIAETVDEPYCLMAASRGLGYLYLRKGDFNEAIRFLERSRELSLAWRIRSFIPGIFGYLGHAHALSGRLTEGLSFFEQWRTESAAMGESSGRAECLANLSEAYRLAHREDDAIRIAHQALHFARDHNRRAHEAWALRALAEIASHRDSPHTDSAETYYRQAIVRADELGMRPIVAHCHFGLGKLYGRMGTRQEAREHLETAAAMYREMGMRFWLEQIEMHRF